MREVCENCKYNKRSFDGHCNSEFCCGNEESDMYGVPTMFDDTCDDFEEKEQIRQRKAEREKNEQSNHRVW